MVVYKEPRGARPMSELPIIERQVVRVVLLDALERILLFHTRDGSALLPPATARVNRKVPGWRSDRRAARALVVSVSFVESRRQ